MYTIEEDEIKAEIEQNYPECRYELFKKDEEFTGMIKITFKTADELNAAISNKFKISNRLFRIEHFQHKPRVIKCNVCQMFGHISRRCRNKQKPVCGKCSCEGHESKDCQKSEDQYKCFHCGSSSHMTGSYSCKKVLEKYEELKERRQNV